MEPEAAEIRDRGCASDNSEAALIVIMKRRKCTSGEARFNQTRRIPALLHRHWSDSGQRLALLVRTVRQVSNDNNFWMARDGEIRFYKHTPFPIQRSAGPPSQNLSKFRRCYARGPQDRAGLYSLISSAGRDDHAALIHIGNPHPGSGTDTEADEGALGSGGKIQRIRR